jgi:hypothetical protein
VVLGIHASACLTALLGESPSAVMLSAVDNCCQYCNGGDKLQGMTSLVKGIALFFWCRLLKIVHVLLPFMLGAQSSQVLLTHAQVEIPDWSASLISLHRV